ncbi:heptaprenyl diphosphate synthase [Alkalibaculum sp. M08DMB]|uniref:Heptaprenyl diphosphate synthase n=1 Tax=Alkalibaculum sporogenes TaxID=2655001 RepID=A0A6A7KC20_9FIRM|nr:Gx transporter family protein [Alkalibaculum sporogenes]MPW26902.1 heptaprenyl diphosphate synthase [Alkalibaculum sporogenes]
MKIQTRKLVFISMLVAQAMILSYVESLLPAIPIPGAKLGFANIATLLALSTLSFKESFLIVVARTVLSSFMFGNMNVLMYSLTGGILSLIAMYFILELFKSNVSFVGVSIVGAIFHNIGQLIVAWLVLNINIFVLLPYLLLVAIPTGLFVGFSSNYLLKYLHKSNFNFKDNR